jgi:hypothetical protein
MVSIATSSLNVNLCVTTNIGSVREKLTSSALLSRADTHVTSGLYPWHASASTKSGLQN